MTRESIIAYPQGKVLVIRESLVSVCEGAPDPRCAAALLNQAVYWTNIRSGQREQAQAENTARATNPADHQRADVSLWFWRRVEDWKAECMGLFGTNKVRDNLAWLCGDEGYMERRENPISTLDKTMQYRLYIGLLQTVLNAYAEGDEALKLTLRDVKNNGSPLYRDSVDKSVTPNGVALSPEGQASGGEQPMTEAEQIVGCISAYVKGLPAKPATNLYANKTVRGQALALVNAGITPEQITEFTRLQKQRKFWQGKLPTFQFIADSVGIWLAEGKPQPTDLVNSGGASRSAATSPRPKQADTPEGMKITPEVREQIMKAAAERWGNDDDENN